MINTISFPNIFNKRNNNTQLLLATNIMSINQSLKSLISTNAGELLGDPAYGTPIKSMLFELNSTTNQYVIKKMLVEKIAKYEPRINTNENLIKIYSQFNSSKYKLSIGYYINQYNDLQTFEMIINNV